MPSYDARFVRVSAWASGSPWAHLLWCAAMVSPAAWSAMRHAQPLLPNPLRPTHRGASLEHGPCPHPIRNPVRLVSCAAPRQEFPYRPRIARDLYPNDRHVNDQVLRQRSPHPMPRHRTNPKSFALHDPNQLGSMQDQFHVQNGNVHLNGFLMHGPCMPCALDQKTQPR